MCEKQKPETKTKAEIIKKEESEAENSIVKEQTERSYYYDDSCGYEVYIEEGIEDEN